MSLIKVLFAVAAATVTAVTGTTVLVKKNKTVGGAYVKHTPKLIQTSCSFVESQTLRAAYSVPRQVETAKALVSTYKSEEQQKLTADYKAASRDLAIGTLVTRAADFRKAQIKAEHAKVVAAEEKAFASAAAAKK